MRVGGGPCINEVAHVYILLLYLKATRLAIDDVAMSCSHQMAILLTMLLASSRIFLVLSRLPTYRNASCWPIPLQTPREAVEPNKSNLFLVGTLMWHRKGVIADSGKIID